MIKLKEGQIWYCPDNNLLFLVDKISYTHIYIRYYENMNVPYTLYVLDTIQQSFNDDAVLIGKL